MVSFQLLEMPLVVVQGVVQPRSVCRMTPGVRKAWHTRNTAFNNRKCEKETKELLTTSSLYCSRPRSSLSTYSKRSIAKSSSASASSSRLHSAWTTSNVLDSPREYRGSMNPAACDIRHQR